MSDEQKSTAHCAGCTDKHFVSDAPIIGERKDRVWRVITYLESENTRLSSALASATERETYLDEELRNRLTDLTNALQASESQVTALTEDRERYEWIREHAQSGMTPKGFLWSFYLPIPDGSTDWLGDGIDNARREWIEQDRIRAARSVPSGGDTP